MSALNDRFIAYVKVTDTVKYKLIFRFPGGPDNGSDVLLPQGSIVSFELDRSLRDSIPIGMQEADQTSIEINLDYLIQDDNYNFATIAEYFVKGAPSFAGTLISMSGTSSIDLVLPNHLEILSNEDNSGAETYDKRIFAGVQEFNQEVELTNQPFELLFTSDIKYAKSQLSPDYIDLDYDIRNDEANTNNINMTDNIVDINYEDSADSIIRNTTHGKNDVIGSMSFEDLQNKIDEQATYIIRKLRKNNSYDLNNSGLYMTHATFYTGLNMTENYNKGSSASPTSLVFIAHVSRPSIIVDVGFVRITAGGMLDPEDADGFTKRFKTCWDLENALCLNFYTKGLINYGSTNADVMAYNAIYSKRDNSATNWGTITINSYDVDIDTIKLKINLFNHKRSTTIAPNLVTQTGENIDKDSLSLTDHEYSYSNGVLNLNAEEPENEIVFHNNPYIALPTVSDKIYISYFLSKNAIYQNVYSSSIRNLDTVPANFYSLLKIHDACKLNIDEYNAEEIETEDLTSPTNFDVIPQIGVKKDIIYYNKWVNDRNVQSGLPYLLSKADVEVFTKNKMSMVELDLESYALTPSDIGSKVDFNNLEILAKDKSYISSRISNEFILSAYKIRVSNGETKISVELFGTGR